MADRRQPRAVLTTYFEATAEAMQRCDDYPWFGALLGLVATVVVGGALVVWLF